MVERYKNGQKRNRARFGEAPALFKLEPCAKRHFIIMPPKKGSAATAAKKQGGNKKASSTAGKGKKPSTEEPEEKGKARFSVLHPTYLSNTQNHLILAFV